MGAKTGRWDGSRAGGRGSKVALVLSGNSGPRCVGSRTFGIAIVAALVVLSALPVGAIGGYRATARTPTSLEHGELRTSGSTPVSRVDALLRQLPVLPTGAICKLVLGTATCESRAVASSSGAGQSNVWLNQSTTQANNLATNSATLGGLADDPADSYVVRFGGVEGSTTIDSTWSYVNGTWRNVTSGASPSDRFLPAMTYDYADGYVLLFGGLQIVGSNITSYGDTWAFQHGAWTQLVTPSSPTARGGASLVYDPTLGGVVLFGGTSSLNAFDNDTWLYRAGNWSKLDASGTAPSGRFGASLAWDSNAQEVVAFGGASICPLHCSSLFPGHNDTWAFQNGSWSNLTAAGGPPTSTAFNSQLVNVSTSGELVLFEDLNASVPGDCQTWSYTAGTWAQLNLTPQACGMADPEATWDSEDGAAIFYGSSSNILFEPTWAFAGGAWTQADNDSYPGPLVAASLAYDPADASAYLVGGQSALSSAVNPATYRFDGSEWHVLGSTVGPIPRTDAAFAYDPPLGGLVLYGGGNTTAFLNDTWLLKGAAWSELAAANASPPGRADPSMTYDPSLGGLLLFGGDNATFASLNDTWLLNGTTWTQLHPATSPAARSGAALAFDPVRGAAVLFGGIASTSDRSTVSSDTWEFRTGDWQEISVVGAPPPRADGSFVYDPAAGGDVLYGGVGATAILGDAWILTASGWSTIISSTTPTPRAYANLYFDTGRNTAWIYGGVTTASTFSGELVYGELYEFDTLAVTASANVTSGPAPLSVNFTAGWTGGSGAVSVQWSFGDGQTSALPNVTHVYDRGGNYTARLTGSDALGVAVSWTVVINASGVGVTPLNVTATASTTSGHLPLTVNFTAAARGGIGPYTFAWTFGDSTVGSSANVSHTYDSVAVFNATVTAQDSIGSTAASSFAINVSNVSIPPPPPPHGLPNASSWYVVLVVSPSQGAAPLTVSAVANVVAVYGTTTYGWSFGDGGTASGNSVQHTYTTAGTFAVIVTARDSIGDVATNETNVTVAEPAPHAIAGSGSVPTVDLLAIVAAAALVLVGVTAYLTRVARRRARGEESPSPDPATESASEPTVEREPPT